MAYRRRSSSGRRASKTKVQRLSEKLETLHKELRRHQTSLDNEKNREAERVERQSRIVAIGSEIRNTIDNGYERNVIGLRVLSARAKKRLRELRGELAALRNAADSSRYVSSISGREEEALKSRIAELHKDTAELGLDLEIAKARKTKRDAAAERKRLKEEKALELQQATDRTNRAKIAKADGRTREHASRKKKVIGRDHPCPYCGQSLGKSPHLDHVFPVSRGGDSRDENLVHCCDACNIIKGDRTLAMFIRDCHLDRDAVESRLLKLGKEF